METGILSRRATAVVASRGGVTSSGCTGADRVGGGTGARVMVALLAVSSGLAGSQPSRADTLRGTPGRDVLNFRAGNDLVLGLGGKDTLGGGPGRDLVLGGSGNDALRGGPGGDTSHWRLWRRRARGRAWQ